MASLFITSLVFLTLIGLITTSLSCGYAQQDESEFANNDEEQAGDNDEEQAGDNDEEQAGDNDEEQAGDNGLDIFSMDDDDDGILNSEDKCPNGDDEVDNDKDGVPDACDSLVSSSSQLDDDNIRTTIQLDDNISTGIQLDNDDDGIPNSADNCPNTFNPEQRDSDGDILGDACDFISGHDNHTNSVDSTSDPVSCTRTIILDLKNGQDAEIKVERDEKICIESEDGIGHGELCDGSYGGNTELDVENARLIYTPNDNAQRDFLRIINGVCPR